MPGLLATGHDSGVAVIGKIDRADGGRSGRVEGGPGSSLAPKRAMVCPKEFVDDSAVGGTRGGCAGGWLCGTILTLGALYRAAPQS